MRIRSMILSSVASLFVSGLGFATQELPHRDVKSLVDPGEELIAEASYAISRANVVFFSGWLNVKNAPFHTKKIRLYQSGSRYCNLSVVGLPSYAHSANGPVYTAPTLGVADYEIPMGQLAAFSANLIQDGYSRVSCSVLVYAVNEQQPPEEFSYEAATSLNAQVLTDLTLLRDLFVQYGDAYAVYLDRTSALHHMIEDFGGLIAEHISLMQLREQFLDIDTMYLDLRADFAPQHVDVEDAWNTLRADLTALRDLLN